MIKNFFRWQFVLIVFKKFTCFKLENDFSLKLFWIFSFKVDSTLSTALDPDPDWAKILDPDPNSMYLDRQHWLGRNLSTTYLELTKILLRSIPFKTFFKTWKIPSLQIRIRLEKILSRIRPIDFTKNFHRKP